jgi:hypothetical protein
MKSTEDLLLETVYQLKNEGYSQDFEIHGNHIHLIQGNAKYSIEEFEVDKGYQFNCSTTGDCSALYSISSNDKKVKGVLVDYYDSMRELDGEISKKFGVKAEQSEHDDLSRSTRYGLNKVFKEMYNENPERYELRIGYPDFPKCPFGETFKMLGYDNSNKEYVWLVTSVLKDERLKRVNY